MREREPLSALGGRGFFHFQNLRQVADVFHCGDVLAFCGQGCLSRVIRFATLGPYSHVAIIAQHHEDNHLVIYESTSRSSLPCLITGTTTSGVQSHEIAELTDGRHVWHFRLNTPLDPAKCRIISDWLYRHRGDGYDYSDAIAARSVGFGWLRNLIARWCRCVSDDAEWICSDLVASALHAVKRFPKRWDHVSPARLIRELTRHGTVSPGERVP